MTNLPDQRGNAFLLAAALSAAGSLFAQTAASADVRAELSARQDLEYRLSDALLNGLQAAFADPPPSITFHSSGLISGSTGMNQYFARIKVTPDGRFRLDSGGLATTRQAGAPQDLAAEARFLNALESTSVIRLETDGILFESEDHATRLRFTRPPILRGLPKLNEELFLVRFVSNANEIALPPNVTITLTFQDGGRISGHSAVNTYGGVFTVMPAGKMAVQVTVATQLAGPAELMALEKQYFDALSNVQQARLKGGEILLENGTTSLEFAVRPLQ